MPWEHLTDVTVYKTRARIICKLDEKKHNTDYRTWAGLGAVKQGILTKAVAIAPAIVQSALDGLNDYLGRCYEDARQGRRDCRDEAVWLGLAKYFCLFDTSNIDYWFSVQSIIEVFETVLEGMQVTEGTDGFVVSLIDKGEAGMKAGVLKAETASPGTTPSRIRQLFGYEDEYGHTPWFPVSGPICLNISYYFGPSPPARANSDTEEVWMARTIVHEGTHKWAQTKDIMYKHSSYGAIATAANAEAKKWVDMGKAPQTFKSEKTKEVEKINQELKKKKEPLRTLPTDQELLQMYLATNFVKYSAGDQFEKAQQHSIAGLPGRENKIRPYTGVSKPFTYMAGTQSHEGVGRTDEGRWLENADSYAWFARRIWKKEGKKGT